MYDFFINQCGPSAAFVVEIQKYEHSDVKLIMETFLVRKCI